MNNRTYIILILYVMYIVTSCSPQSEQDAKTQADGMEASGKNKEHSNKKAVDNVYDLRMEVRTFQGRKKGEVVDRFGPPDEIWRINDGIMITYYNYDKSLSNDEKVGGVEFYLKNSIVKHAGIVLQTANEDQAPELPVYDSELLEIQKHIDSYVGKPREQLIDAFGKPEISEPFFQGEINHYCNNDNSLTKDKRISGYQFILNEEGIVVEAMLVP